MATSFYDNKCILCGRVIRYWSREHFIPKSALSKVGYRIMDGNIFWACRDCNCIKNSAVLLPKLLPKSFPINKNSFTFFLDRYFLGSVGEFINIEDQDRLLGPQEEYAVEVWKRHALLNCKLFSNLQESEYVVLQPNRIRAGIRYDDPSLDTPGLYVVNFITEMLYKRTFKDLQ